MSLSSLATSIPSPSSGVLELGSIPLRAYAFGILIGDVAMWAIPFGIVGARIYHVITDNQLYFGEGRRPIEALYIWQGGLGIWGAIGLGALGAYIACRINKVSFLGVADALAPGILIAQAIGRWGNYFNQELFGKPTNLPWGLEIDPIHRPDGYEQFATFHPTFLYESLWNLSAALLILWIDRKYRLTGGRMFALYVMVYTAGRTWIELMRIDPANDIGPFRINVWTSMILFVLALAYFVLKRRSTVAVEPMENADDRGTD